MPSISSLIEYPEAIGPTTPCAAVLDRFLDSPDCDLLVVTVDDKPKGVIGRGMVRAAQTGGAAADVMIEPLTIGADMEVDDACALILANREPTPGLVVVERGLYRGVVSTRRLLRHRCDEVASSVGNRRFVELVSHEVRTPMNGVLALAELLQRQPLSVDSQAHVRTIIDSSHATLRALNDAIELSRADAHELTMDLAPVALRELMDQVQENWQARAAQDGVMLLVAYDGEPDLRAMVDAGRIKQVFDALIDTALTMNRRGAVEASLQAIRAESGVKLTGRVRDTGGGLSASRLADAFGDQGAAGEDGGAHLGLGLTLSRRIVERMEGAIRVENNVGAGATIVFEHVVAEASAPVEAADAASVTKRSAHVLVVDDNATNRMVAEALCEMFDCTSESVEDGVEAVEAARTGRFDLILMDIKMPRMDGVEATRAIRSLPGAPGAVPIIALTANADPEDAKTYIATGMHSVVEKPIKPERLLQAINEALPEAKGRPAAAA